MSNLTQTQTNEILGVRPIGALCDRSDLLSAELPLTVLEWDGFVWIWWVRKPGQRGRDA